MMKSPKKWYKVTMRYIFVLFLIVLLFPIQTHAEETYDLNKVRLKIFHLLNFSPADNTLITQPGSGSKATPTPAPGSGATPTPTPAGSTGTVLTRIFIPEASGDNVVGAGTYTTSTNSYRLQITKPVPLKTKAAGNKYYMWLSKTDGTPALNELISSFDTASLPSTDKTYAKNLSTYNELIVTEESATTTPTTPNFSAVILRGTQGPATAPTATPTPGGATPTSVPPTPTPGGGGKSLGDFLRGIFGL
jgi:hypothetical protein